MSPSALRKTYIGLFLAGVFPFFINGALNPVIHRYPLLYWGFELLVWLVLPAIVFAVAMRHTDLRWHELGVGGDIRGRRRIGWLLALCMVAGPVDLLLYSNAKYFFNSLFPPAPLFDYRSVVPETEALRVIVVVYLGISAGIVEELYFRGFFWRISELFSNPKAVYLVASPVLFALIHWEGGLSNVLATFTVGLACCLFFLAVRNIWPLIVGHIYTDIYWYW